MNRICVFCGAASGAHERYSQAAQEMGKALAQRGIDLVFGGGRVGLMGATADAVLAAGGKVIGVIPRALAEREVAHAGLTELHVVTSMHERKALMAELSDAFITLPGGYGTLEEFAEVLTWAQLGIHRKPLGILNIRSYYDGLLTFFDHSVVEGFVNPLYRSMIQVGSTPDALLDLLANYQPPKVVRWIDESQT